MTQTATEAINRLRGDLFRVKRGTVAHAHTSTPISSPNAMDLASAITLANECRSALNTHFGNVFVAETGGAHCVADANTIGTSAATNESEIGLLVQEMIARFNAHC